MTDSGHDLLFGAFVTPAARGAAGVVDLAVTAERAGLDLVAFQDHPYLADFSTPRPCWPTRPRAPSVCI